MTPERIAELRALADAATPGPWWASADFITTKRGSEPERKVYSGHVIEPSVGTARSDDAAFIAESRSALIEALDALERVRYLAEHPQQRWNGNYEYLYVVPEDIIRAIDGKTDV